MNYILNLPIEILVVILNYIDFKGLIRFSGTCKSFRRVVLDKSLFKCTSIIKKDKITFEAIKDFVDDLWEEFATSLPPSAGRSIDPFYLYYSFITQLDEINTLAIRRVVEGFERFYLECEREDEDGKIIYHIKNVTSIEESRKRYIHIGRMVKIGDSSIKILFSFDETFYHIQRHLLLISAYISPTDNKFDQLEKEAVLLEEQAKRERFIKEASKRGKKQAWSLGNSLREDPSTHPRKSWSSGSFLTDIFFMK